MAKKFIISLKLMKKMNKTRKRMRNKEITVKVLKIDQNYLFLPSIKKNLA